MTSFLKVKEAGKYTTEAAREEYRPSPMVSLKKKKKECGYHREEEKEEKKRRETVAKKRENERFSRSWDLYAPVANGRARELQKKIRLKKRKSSEAHRGDLQIQEPS